MPEAGSVPVPAEMLLRGPRGRRLLLEFALASARAVEEQDRGASLLETVFLASYHLDPGKRTSRVVFGPWAEEAERTIPAPADAAAELSTVPLLEASPGLLRECLAESVEAARYWEEPDGADVLAASAEMRAELSRVAEHIAASPAAAWWWSPVDHRTQWVLQWDDPPERIGGGAHELLSSERELLIREELAARRERPVDPTAHWSGEWWSRPPLGIPSSSRALFDGAPAGLWLVEDSWDWENAWTARLGLPAGLRTLEIEAAETWAGLCSRFPLEVTAQKRHDWFRATGRAGRWVMPDWAGVAEHYDAVHLQVGAYLSAAGSAIPVGTDTATVIAGWDPDRSYWFSSTVRLIDEPLRWTRSEREDEIIWQREQPTGRT
ncbi:hypothetical protein J4H92_11890 [Leucobacter weissii]|uniref:Uncharacterized protein n=1 Tax=Leucobacter weissii TaxID=1983706 RepID=A0A939MQ39_9MICO|nr:hypothetical protein [Leucobacter weissii]MBO1902647.1 hypothetical protein [Leucobacter weissii]